MRTRAVVRGSRLLVAAICVAVTLLAGCGNNAFESNDYVMTFLTSQAVGKQIKNASGRGEDSVTSGILSSAEVIDDMRIADDTRDEAMGIYSTGDFSMAGQVLDEAIALRPDDIRYRDDRALIDLAQGNTDGALVQWEEHDRIAELNGWDKTDRYWDQQLADAQSLIVDIRQGRMENWPSSDQEEAARLGAAFQRYADVLSQTADFRQESGQSPELVELARKAAAQARADAARENQKAQSQN